MADENRWWVYILECADQTLYTGITTDPERRLYEHNHHKTGAKYTKARRPVCLVYQEPCLDRATAARRESEIKHFKRSQKLSLINRHLANS